MVLDPWLMILPWHLGCHYLRSPPPMPDFLGTLSQLSLTCWVLKVALVNTLTGWVGILAASGYLAARLSVDIHRNCCTAVTLKRRSPVRDRWGGALQALAKNGSLLIYKNWQILPGRGHPAGWALGSLRPTTPNEP